MAILTLTLVSYNNRQARNYHLFSVNTSIRKNSAIASGPKIWNALSKDIKNAVSLIVFKRKLKHHLVSKYVD